MFLGRSLSAVNNGTLTISSQNFKIANTGDLTCNVNSVLTNSPTTVTKNSIFSQIKFPTTGFASGTSVLQYRGITKFGASTTASASTKFSASTAGNVPTAGTLSVTGNSTLTGTLTVSGVTTIPSLLTISVPNAVVSGVTYQITKNAFEVDNLGQCSSSVANSLAE